MTAVQIHLRPPEPATVEPPARGWKLAGPLTDWRDDDPDALLRCSLDGAHVIRNGDHYAIGGIKLVCLACARLSPPRAPSVVLSAPKPKPRAASTAERQFGGAVRQIPRKTAPAAPRAPVAAPAAVVEPPSPVRPRIALGPTHPDHGREQAYGPAPRPQREAFREERPCERCPATFIVTSANRRQRLCGNGCVLSVAHERRRQVTAERAPVRIAVVEASVCVQCGAEHQPIPARPHHCSWACVWLSAAAPHALGDSCPCFGCATGRQESGMAPLIGLVTS